MPSQALPVRQSLLKVSVGLSGIIHAFCSSAIATPLASSDDTLPEPAQQTFFQPLPSGSQPILSAALPISDISIGDRNLHLRPPVSIEQPSLLSVPTTPLEPTEFQKTDAKASEKRLCQLLESCDRDITFNIDATKATAIGELAEADAVSSKTFYVEDAGYSKASFLRSVNPEATNSGSADLESADLEAATRTATPLESASLEPVLLTSLALSSIDSSPASGSDAFSQRDSIKQRSIEWRSQTAQETGDLEAGSVRSDSDRALSSGSDTPAKLDDELGTIRAKPIRRGDLGILRLLQTSVPPPPPSPPIAFLSGRLSYIDSENALRLDSRLSDEVYQSGLAFRLYPDLSESTSLYAIAEAGIGRFERDGSRGYNELELQLGVRQEILPQTYAQIGLRNQRFYSRDFGDGQILGINYIDTSLSHRAILDKKTWLDSFYQARLGFSDPETSSRFRQTFTLSLNHAISKELRTNILYQLALEDYTQISRYDISHQFIGTLSYRVTPESRITLFAGTRFGTSSGSDPITSLINLDDTFYGAEVSVNLPLF